MTVLVVLSPVLALAGVLVGYLLARPRRPSADVLLTAPIETKMPTNIEIGPPWSSSS